MKLGSIFQYLCRDGPVACCFGTLIGFEAEAAGLLFPVTNNVPA